MDVPQSWMDRNALDLGVEDADALNDETFGDDGGWDEPDPVCKGDNALRFEIFSKLLLI